MRNHPSINGMSDREGRQGTLSSESELQDYFEQDPLRRAEDARSKWKEALRSHNERTRHMLQTAYGISRALQNGRIFANKAYFSLERKSQKTANISSGC